MINTVYIAMYTPEAVAPKCLGAYTTRKNAEDVLIKHYREYYKKFYSHLLEIHLKRAGGMDGKMLNTELEHFTKASDYELLVEMEHNDYFTIIAAPIDEPIETAIYNKYE